MNKHSQQPRFFWCGPASIFALLLGLLPPSAAHAQTVLPAAIREELAVLHDAKDVSPEAIGRLCEIGDATPQQNLQQLCYKTACAGLAYLGETNRYEEVLAKVITKTFADVFQEQCPRCRGIGKTMVTCPDCEGRRCPSCSETGQVKARCPDCNGTASVFSRERALSAYRRGLAALAKSPEPVSAQTPPQSATPRLTDDQFFARHSLDLAAYAVFTNSASTSIQKNEAFQKIAARAYVPKGFSSAVLLYRYPNGESFEVSDVSDTKEAFRVNLRRKGDPWSKQLIVPKSVAEVAGWQKGRSVTSRDWVFTVVAYSPLAPSYPGPISTAGSVFYRSVAEFRRLHPGAEDTEIPSATPQLTPRLADDQFFARHTLDLSANAVSTNSAPTSIQKSEAFETEDTEPPSATPRLADDQFFARHTLDLSANAVSTNSAPMSIQKSEAFETEDTETPSGTTRLADDPFFTRHSLDLAANAVSTNSVSMIIQKNEVFTTIARRANKPHPHRFSVPSSFIYTIYFLTFIILLIGILSAFVKSSPRLKGWFGEMLLHNLLKVKLDDEKYHILHNIMLPTEDSATTQIDHIVVSQWGVFVIETKTYSGWIFGDAKSPQWTVTHFRRKDRFQNPLRQNYKHLATLSECLGIPMEYFKTIVAFSGEVTFKTEMPPEVMFIGDVPGYIQRCSQQPIIKTDQVPEVVEAILAWQQSLSRERKAAHVDNLRKNHPIRS